MRLTRAQLIAALQENVHTETHGFMMETRFAEMHADKILAAEAAAEKAAVEKAAQKPVPPKEQLVMMTTAGSDSRAWSDQDVMHFFHLPGGHSCGKTAAAAREVSRATVEQREDICRAFVAKYGLEPEECEQVTETKGGCTTVYVRRKACVIPPPNPEPVNHPTNKEQFAAIRKRLEALEKADYQTLKNREYDKRLEAAWERTDRVEKRLASLEHHWHPLSQNRFDGTGANRPYNCCQPK